jgi:hypothetical protein
MYGRAAALLSQAPASIERDEQVRVVADRLRLTDDLAARLTTQAPAAQASRARPVRLRRSPRDRDERLFLALCVAIPDRGAALLADESLAGLADGDAVRRIVADGVGPEDAHLVAELSAVAAREPVSEAVLDELFWKLRLAIMDDRLKALRQNADLDLDQQRELQRLEELRLELLGRLESARAQAPDR